ncbi:MAG: magnesium transporter MgtE N-terminal domain-containing protein [Gemmatimonadaceae bacterium]
MTATAGSTHAAPHGAEYQLHFFSQLLDRPVAVSRPDLKIGTLDDLVFKVAEPFPEAVGLVVAHRRGLPNEFIPWERVTRIDPHAIVVMPPDHAERYPSFVDQPGWLLLNEHLIGRTILDMDGRKVELVNDVHLLASHGRMIIAHVDVSLNGFLRKWGLGLLALGKDRLISWSYVQPLSIEDATSSDKVSLSLAREQLQELPSEDLADALEELSGREQEAMFSVLEPEKAADTLLETEPRAQRQIVADLPPDRAKEILSEMSVGEIADLLSALPHDDRTELLAHLSPEESERVKHILGTHEATAGSLLSQQFVALSKQLSAGEAIRTLRERAPDADTISYLYVVTDTSQVLLGVVDLRELVLARESATLEELMVSPVVSVDSELGEQDVAELFEKYNWRMLPVVDAGDHLLGVIGYKDVRR